MERLSALFASDEHAAVEATWEIYQAMVAAYRHKDRSAGRAQMGKVITAMTTGVPADLPELGNSVGP